MASTRHIEWTELDGQRVIVTEGGIVTSSGRIYGLFASVDDAVSGIDSAAIGTVSADKLSAAQREMAQRNSERLSE